MFLSFKELFDFINTGKTLDVQFAKYMADEIEGYFEEGMRAILVSVEIDGVYGPGDCGGETVYELKFDIKPFEDHNKSIEVADYYDTNGNACLKASQTKFYPHSGTENVYFGEYKGSAAPSKFFKVISEVSEILYKEYTESGCKDGYTDWLEAEVLKVRGE